MTMARTALRLCVVEALKGATIAAERIWDSRIPDLNPDEFATDALPTVLLMTDKDEGEQMSMNNGGPPFFRNVDLQFDVGFVRAVGSAGAYEAAVPTTDAQLEASLDLFEFQLLRHLQYAQTPLCLMFRKIARIVKYDSHRQVLDDGSPKMAMRLLTLTCNMQDDRVTLVPSTDNPQPTGYALLPWPLSEVAALMPAGSNGKLIVDALAAGVGKINVPPFVGMDTTLTAAGMGEPVNPDAASNEFVAPIEPEQP